MAQQSSNFRFFQGDTQPFWIDFTIGGLPYNIAGYSIIFAMVGSTKNLNGATYKKKIVLPDDTESRAGHCMLTIESDESAEIQHGSYIYNMKMISPGSPSTVLTFISGVIVVLADITGTLST